MALITPTTSYDGFDQVDIVVEAVFENMDLKKATFAELGKVTRPDCILASNTSTLDIDEFARGERPAGAGDRPPLLQPGERDEAARDRPRARDQQGGDRHVAEARASGSARSASSSATASGSSPTGCSPTTCARRTCCSRKARASPQIDRVLTEFGLPVGPFGMQDIAGIDVGARIRQYLASIGKTRAEGPQSAMPDRLFEMGRYGQKTGAGWYKIRRARQPQPHSRSADRASSPQEAAAERGITRRPIADEEIVARITTALANEGARVLEEGFAHARRRHRRHLRATASASRATAAARCSTPTRSACRRCSRA